MNVNNLEKLVRGALKGEDTGSKGNSMVNSGLINPIEHRSLQSLSFQIATNLHADKNAGTVAMIRPHGTWI